MKSVCFCFQVHQPFRHRRYRFFDIGSDHYYYDDYTNDSVMQNIATISYLPAFKMLLKLAGKFKNDFRISFSISGLALEQLKLYAPEVIDVLKELSASGCAEIVSETYSHSLSSLNNPEMFAEQVKLQENTIDSIFGYRPRVFRNTEMIYSDKIGAQVAALGYDAMLTEGANHILGWKSPGFVYVNSVNPRLKVLMRDFSLSDDIAFRFSDKNWDKYPLTADKFISWFDKKNQKEEVVNLFMSLEAFGGRQTKESGIFDFLESLIRKIIIHHSLKLSTPSEVIDELQPVSAVKVPVPVSWADEERDITAWLGNEMQKEAFEKLCNLKTLVDRCNDKSLKNDWNYLQASDHFFYMSTKYLTDGQGHHYYNPFDTPYEAFINYMNVLSDFKNRLEQTKSGTSRTDTIEELQKIIKEKDLKISELETKIKTLELRNSLKK